MESIDDHLLKAYALWGKNRVEFNRDGRLTLITFIWNEKRTRRERKAISMCVGGVLMRPAQSFAPGPDKDCYTLAQDVRIDEVIDELTHCAPVEIYLHEKIKA